MVTSRGLRAHTRDKYSKAFRQKGMPSVGTYLKTYKRGDYVDIICDPSVQKGMPFYYYHGRCGIVFNVTQNSVGVEVNKVIGNRQLKKRFHVRVEHVRHSTCRDNFLNRVKENDRLVKEMKAKGEPVVWPKRLPAQPKEGKMISGADFDIEVMAPISYDPVKELGL